MVCWYISAKKSKHRYKINRSLMLWLVLKFADYFWYCIGGAANQGILFAKWLG